MNSTGLRLEQDVPGNNRMDAIVGSFSLTKRLIGPVLALSLLWPSALAGNRNMYLAATGPAPLRFAATLAQYNPARVLPLLDLGDAPKTNVVETTRSTEMTLDTSSLLEAVPPVPPRENVSMEPVSIPAEQPIITPEGSIPPEVKPGQSQITPQMLLRYFNRDGTQAGSKEVVVPMPVEFTPPGPVNSPATPANKSSALYLSPAAK